MKPQPLEGRIFAALRLEPMTTQLLASCLCASRGAVQNCLERLRAGGQVTRHRLRTRNGRPANLWQVAA